MAGGVRVIQTVIPTHFVQALNAEKYCGYTDWRMPTLDEMQTIVVVGNGGGSGYHKS